VLLAEQSRGLLSLGRSRAEGGRLQELRERVLGLDRAEAGPDLRDLQREIVKAPAPLLEPSTLSPPPCVRSRSEAGRFLQAKADEEQARAAGQGPLLAARAPGADLRRTMPELPSVRRRRRAAAAAARAAR
jgi:hypothetical protein